MRSARPTGFTLLELLVVIAMMALLATVATTRIGGNYQRAVLETTITKLTALDSHARGYAAVRHQNLELRIDLTEGDIKSLVDKRVVTSPYSLPKTVTIERFLSLRERKTSGVATVRFGVHGESETYALKLSVPARPAKWLVFVGGSGQVIPLNTAREVEEVFRALKTNSPHAA